MNKEHFASYLEETAAEIRALAMTPAYLDDMCASLFDATKEFWIEQEEMARLKIATLEGE